MSTNLYFFYLPGGRKYDFKKLDDEYISKVPRILQPKIFYLVLLINPQL